MLDFFNALFFLQHYLPHGHCYLWQTGLVWLHLISDLLIVLSYYSIPLQLLYFVRQREDVPFKGIFFLFSLFIITCGTTHLMAVCVRCRWELSFRMLIARNSRLLTTWLLHLERVRKRLRLCVMLGKQFERAMHYCSQWRLWCCICTHASVN